MGSDLGRQTDALGFSAGQRTGKAVQCQIFQTDILQELQTLPDLLQDHFRDLCLCFTELQLIDPAEGVRNRQGCVFHDVLIGNHDGQRLFVQTLSTALGAGALHHEGMVPVLGPGTLGFPVAAFDQILDAFDVVIAGILVARR